MSNQTTNTNNQVQDNKDLLLMQSLGIKAEQIKVTPTKSTQVKVP